jgi:hypothetical protein
MGIIPFLIKCYSVQDGQATRIVKFSMPGSECANCIFNHYYICKWYQNSSVSIVTRLQAEQLKNCVLTPSRGNRFYLFSKASMLALGPTQPTGELISWGYSGWGVELTMHLHLVPRLRVIGATPPLTHMPS